MVLAAVLLTAVGILGIAGLGDRTPGSVPTVAPAPGGEDEQGLPDPFAWDPEREDEFVRRAAAGTSHVLYTLSPGGVLASAARTARWRPQVEAAASAAGVDPDTLEGLVFLESAGRDGRDHAERHRGRGRADADPRRDGPEPARHARRHGAQRRYTRRIGRELARGHAGKVARLRRARARGRRALRPRQGAGGHGPLPHARPRPLGREDLAFVSYHMGIGNLQGVLRAYGGGDARDCPELYFDSTPRATPPPTRSCSRSATTLELLLEGRRGAGDHAPVPPRPAELARLTALQTAKASAEEVLHPAGSTPRFADPEELQRGVGRRGDRRLPGRDRA